MLLILDATNNWSKSKSFLPAHPANQQSCLQENSVKSMLYETCTCIYDKRILITQDCTKFCKTEFFCKQLCWFLGCVGKNNLDFIQSLVAFGISNIGYCCIHSEWTYHKSHTVTLIKTLTILHLFTRKHLWTPNLTPYKHDIVPQCGYTNYFLLQFIIPSSNKSIFIATLPCSHATITGAVSAAKQC